VTSKQEAQWVLRAQLDDREAVQALLSSVQRVLTRYVRAIVGAADAEDVTQDVMVSIYRHLWTLSSVWGRTRQPRRAKPVRDSNSLGSDQVTEIVEVGGDGCRNPSQRTKGATGIECSNLLRHDGARNDPGRDQLRS